MQPVFERQRAACKALSIAPCTCVLGIAVLAMTCISGRYFQIGQLNGHPVYRQEAVDAAEPNSHELFLAYRRGLTDAPDGATPP